MKSRIRSSHVSPLHGRRDALRLAAGALVGLAGAGPASLAGSGAPSASPFDPTARAAVAYAMRIEAARSQRRRAGAVRKSAALQLPFDAMTTYSKGLPHSDIGVAEPAALGLLRAALTSGRSADFEAIPCGGEIRLVNPQAAYAFALEGPDSHTLTLPAPPAFDSAERAAEACELYWQSLTRDVPFAEYASDETIAAAAAELSNLPAYEWAKQSGQVTPTTIFRGATPGECIGPFVSQFLLKEVPFGTIRMVPHIRTATTGLDYLVTWDDWLRVQNGGATVSRHAGTYRYIRSARDLAAYVQLDFSYQPFLTACLVLFGMEGTTDVRRPYKGAPFDPAFPYRTSKTQSGFSTLGGAHALDLVARVANLALRHTWYHKWLVHRTMRPEEFGGRLHVHRTGRARYPIHRDILSAEAVERVVRQRKTSLLPQAYPEGTPLHPSYPSGHAAIAGACATVLKAFFDEAFVIEEPVLPAADGLSLIPYGGPALTVGGELNKLASNVATGRSAAGIHWRSDNSAGLALGEAIALDVLSESRACLHEPFSGFSLTRFDGTQVTV